MEKIIQNKDDMDYIKERIMKLVEAAEDREALELVLRFCRKLLAE